MSEILRTPAERFADLPGYPFAPHYLDELDGFAGLRMHYLDEGPADAAHLFLCLHGQPTWSYLYRRMIPLFVAAGHRVVAPDFFGFGRSDKPADDASYTFDFHLGALAALVERLELERITLVCHDWGGILGLCLLPDIAARIDRLVVMNTFLCTGELPLGKGFLEWRAWANAHPDMEIDRLMRRACPILSPEEAAAYAAPFPDARYKAGVRRFPNLVPAALDDPGAARARRARDWLATEWTGPCFMAVGMADPVLGPPAMQILRGWIRGCPPPLEIEAAGHFVPEWGPEVARGALAAFGE